jgi:hypothetical protein
VVRIAFLVFFAGAGAYLRGYESQHLLVDTYLGRDRPTRQPIQGVGPFVGFYPESLLYLSGAIVKNTHNAQSWSGFIAAFSRVLSAEP